MAKYRCLITSLTCRPTESQDKVKLERTISEKTLSSVVTYLRLMLSNCSLQNHAEQKAMDLLGDSGMLVICELTLFPRVISA